MTGTGTGAIPTVERPMLVGLSFLAQKKRKKRREQAEALAKAVLEGDISKSNETGKSDS